MKTKQLLFFALFPALLLACSQTSNEFSITGHIGGVQDGDFVMLHKVEGRVGKLFMQDTIRNGKFSFKGEVDSLQNIKLTPMGEKYPLVYIDIWIGPGTRTKVTGYGYCPAGWHVKSKVKEQQEAEIYRNATRHLSVISDSLRWVYYREGDKIAKAGSDEERLKQRTLTRTIRQQLDSINFIEHRMIFDVMVDRPVTEQWIDRLEVYAMISSTFRSMSSYPEENMQQLYELYNRLSEEQKQTRKGELIYSYLFPVETVGEGDLMVEGNFFDSDGNEYRITDYTNKGKYILLDFWGVGCGPCIAAFPEMKKVHESHSDKLTIIGISVDSHAVWMEGLEKHQLPWLNLNDFLEYGGYASFYGVHAIPFYVLISPDGIIEKIWMGYRKGMFEEIVKTI